jgi:ATP-dependent Clp protease ATP-binding subunit ClpA
MPYITITGPVTEALQRAREEMVRRGHDSIQPEHILLGILALNQGAASEALDSSGIDRLAFRNRIEPVLPQVGTSVTNPYVDPYDAAAQKALNTAVTAAGGWDAGRMNTACVLLGILTLDEFPMLDAFTYTGVDLPSLRSSLEAHAADFE